MQSQIAYKLFTTPHLQYYSLYHLPQMYAILKAILKAMKNAAYTEPDICLMVLMNGRPEYVTVELKSTKKQLYPRFKCSADNT